MQRWLFGSTIVSETQFPFSQGQAANWQYWPMLVSLQLQVKESSFLVSSKFRMGEGANLEVFFTNFFHKIYFFQNSPKNIFSFLPITRALKIHKSSSKAYT